MSILEMLRDDNQNIRDFGNACLQNAIEEQIEENKGKTLSEMEFQEIIDDILGDLR